MGYELTTNTIAVPCKNGTNLILSLTEDSGRIVTRSKIDTVFGVQHPGIVLGKDQYGRRWIAHHHYKNRYPTIDCEEVYADGNEVTYSSKATSFSQYEILKRALHYWWNGTSYALFSQNCQHFVNIIAIGEHKSDAIEEATDAMLLVSGLSTLVGLFTGNKGLVQFGLGVGAMGGATKYVNRQSSNNALPPYSGQLQF